MKIGKFITIEGIEGAGKSTAIRLLKLEKWQNPIFWTREPGGTILAERIRDLMLNTKDIEPFTHEAELLLVFAARAQHMQAIKHELERGNWVISDRFIDATYAYQGGGRNINSDRIAYLEKWIVQNVMPDFTLLMDIPPAIGIERAHQRGNGKDRIEQEKIDFFIRVRNAYLERAKADPNRMKVIDASLPLADVEKQIKTLLDDFIQRQS